MVLQNYVWKNEEMNLTKELYYHGDAGIYVSDDCLVLSVGSKVSFDTYFNVFMAKTWRRYTNVENACVHVEITGKGTIRLKGEQGRCLEVRPFSGNQEITLKLKLHDSPYFYLEVEAEEESELRNVRVETKAVPQNVALALVTCTYNRQKDVMKNIRILEEFNRKEQILEQIYVIDNARNLAAEEIEGERIRLVPNPNTGGAGGFTRGLKEALQREDISHVILMDDDVHLEPEAFRRTKAFFSYVRKEYTGNFLGGAMFRTDYPYVLHAAGEGWADGKIFNPYKSTDLREFSKVMEVSEPVDTSQAYAGWWYCCIPRSHVVEKGYPMPFFLHCDDVEYSLRSGKPPIYLNGIAVWHEEFEDKRSSVIEYYDTRNRLITNALYKKKWKRLNALYILCERFYATVFRYRYRDFSLTVKAVEDFLKGPEWLEKVDAEALHQELSHQGYLWEMQKEHPEEKGYSPGSPLGAAIRYLLPANGRTVLRMGAPVSAYVGKKEVLLVEPKSGKGFMVRKSWRETVECVGWFVLSGLRLLPMSGWCE